MTSTLAASLLRRRYLLGPLIAFALVGLPATQFDGTADETPAPRATASTVSPAAAASALLKLAHEAEGVYFVDNLVYASAVGKELDTLKAIESRVAWGTDVLVQEPAGEAAASEILILRAPMPGGGSLCMAEISEVEDAGTYYARVEGTATCPPRKPGMPGWTEDQTAGWGA